MQGAKRASLEIAQRYLSHLGRSATYCVDDLIDVVNDFPK